MSSSSRPWKRADIIMFLEQLGLYMSAGLAIDASLSTMSQGLRASQSRTVCMIRDMVVSGTSLSRATASHIRMAPMIVGIISHGEQSGDLVSALVHARTVLERSDELRRACISASVYPIIIALVTSAMTVGLVRGVMPQIVPMLTSLHVTLPLMTRVVIYGSNILSHYGLHISIVVLVGSALCTYTYRLLSLFRTAVRSFTERIPIIGRLVRLYQISIFVRSLASLTGSGISIVRAWDEALRVVTSPDMTRQVTAHVTDIRAGRSVGLVFSRMRRIPPHIAPLIMAGEASGSLHLSLGRAADIIDRDMTQSLRRLTALIEPLMMVGMGVFVGSVALSILMPIYDMSRALQH